MAAWWIIEGIAPFGFMPLYPPNTCEWACIRCVCVCVCQGGGHIQYSGSVDSYRPLNGSNNVKELQCHIHQSLLSVRARQKCWHLNTSWWVRRPFRRQLLDTQACSYRRLVTADCQAVTLGKRPGRMRGWRGTIRRDSMNEHVSVLWGRYSVGTITPVNSANQHFLK